MAGKQGFEPRFHDPESCVHVDNSPWAKDGPKMTENS